LIAEDAAGFGDSVKLADTTTAFATVWVLSPRAIQCTEPVLLAQDKDLPADVAAAPAVILTLLKSLAE
jgi:hypothetical protein